MKHKDKESIEATIKGLEYLIAELKERRIKPINFQVTTPTREKVPRQPFHDHREFEPTGDVYMEFNFVRIKEATL